VQNRASDGDYSEPPIPRGLREMQLPVGVGESGTSRPAWMDSQRDRYPRGREPWAAVAIRTVVPLGTDTSPDAAATN